MDGNFSSMTGNSPGCHPHHSKRYIRRVQVNKDEEAGQIYKEYNPHAVTESVWSANKTDNVISFAIEHDDSAIFKKDLTAIEHLKIVKDIQENWVNKGNRNLGSTSHNVSVTVLVDNNEWDDVKNYIWDNRNYYSGISLLAKTGDLDYTQAAYSEVLTPSELLHKYGDGVIFASGLIVDILDIFGDLWKACDTVKGIGEKIYCDDNDVNSFLIEKQLSLPINYESLLYKEVVLLKDSFKNEFAKLLKELNYSDDIIPILSDIKNINLFKNEIKRYLDTKLFDSVSNLSDKRDIVRRIHKFSDKYFNGDITNTINALKQVNLYHDYCMLVNNTVTIDWNKIEWKNVPKVSADTLAAASCAGGACEI